MSDIVRMFWSGPTLGPYELLCLSSFRDRGFEVLLYTDDADLAVPPGVSRLDITEVIPHGPIQRFEHPNGEQTPTIHANLFRYEALWRFGGWYADLDVVALAASPPQEPIYIGWEDDTHANTAVLRFPQADALMAAAKAVALGLIDTKEWGSSGPKLITRLLRERDLTHLVLPSARVYPVATTEVLKLFLPECREELLARETGADFLHLWNQVWRLVRIPRDAGPPAGSYLETLFKRHDVPIRPSYLLSARAVASWFHDTFELMDRRQNDAIGVNPTALIAERDAMLRSTSWRITAPLRAVSRLMRRG